MAALILSVFTVSVDYGVILPLLPYLVERLLGDGGSARQVSRATGLLTGLYTLSLFVFAPLWGRLSDRFGRRTILLVGMIGFSATMLTFAFVDNLVAVYAERFPSGLFAAAVTPVALAAIGDLAVREAAPGQRLTFVSLAGITGFLLGPMLGVSITRAASHLLASGAAGSMAVPLAGTAMLSIVTAAAVACTLPGTSKSTSFSRSDRVAAPVVPWLVPRLLALAFIVAAGVGVFEVGLALRGKQELGLSQYQIALMFTTCSLVMIVVPAAVFSPWVKPDNTRWLIAPAFALLAVALFLVPRPSSFTLMLAVIGAVAASAGILSPILTYWISSRAGRSQGTELGKQTAATSLGASVGSANASFLSVAVLSLVGALLSLRLPRLLVSPKTIDAGPYVVSAVGQ